MFRRGDVIGRTFAWLATCSALVAGSLASPPAAAGQQRPMPEVHRTPSGEILDYAPDGAWRKEGRRVAAYRQRLLAEGNFAALNAPMLTGVPSPAAVGGTKKIPAILFRFADVGTGAANDTSLYSALLFGSPPPVGKPYSVKTFYREMSNTLLTLDGRVIGWVQLGSNESAYTGGANCSGQNPYGGSQCNGLWSSAASSARLAGLNEALSKVDDGSIDFGQFDNDGPDGIPNSGDDDGFVDLVIFIQSEQDGACYSNTNGHLWSHKGSLPTAFTTKSARTGGGFIQIRSYTLQSGVGGSTACNASQIMPIGTTAHETGHTFGLPDLYDVAGATEGIGEWGLMGSGNYSTPPSPSRMEAWSLNELGWVTLRPLTVNGTYTFGPAPTSDTAFVVRVQGTNTRKEYYLLENRQAVQSDSAMIRVHCQNSGLTYPATCRGGLAIWHADSTKLQAGKLSNTINTGWPNPQGLLLVQADGRGDLQKTTGGNRGDGSDLWPGYGAAGGKTRYSFDTSPKAVTNADTTVFVGFQIDSITQLVPDGDMSFRLLFGSPTIVVANDTLAKVKVDGVAYNRFASLWIDGSSHTIAVDSAQTTADGKTQYVWVSWSDAGLRSHTVTGSFSGATYTATVSTKYKVQATVSGTGTVASAPTVDHTNGAFVDKNSTLTLTAAPGTGMVFERWTGDTNTTVNPLALTMSKPFVLVANFLPQLAVSSGAPPGLVMGKAFSFTLSAAGGNGQYTWQLASGAFPPGITLSSQGLVSGTPTASGSFSATARVTSGTQTKDASLTFAVTEPTLALSNVLNHLLGIGTPLSSDDIAYLDLIGNKNGGFDVGDFLAWVNKNNVSPASPAVLQAVAGIEERKVQP